MRRSLPLSAPLKVPGAKEMRSRCEEVLCEKGAKGARKKCKGGAKMGITLAVGSAKGVAYL